MHVVLSAGFQSFDFAVGLVEHRGTGSRSLTFVELGAAPFGSGDSQSGADARQDPGRVLTTAWFCSSAQKTFDAPGVGDTEKRLLARTCCLACIGCAYRLKPRYVFEELVISKITIAALRNRGPADESIVTPVSIGDRLCNLGDADSDITHTDLIRVVRGSLLHPDIDSQCLDSYYADFEKPLLAKWREICEGTLDWDTRCAGIRAYLETIRKSSERLDSQLAILKAAVSVAYGHVHQNLMGQVLHLPEIKSKLDPTSLQFNNFFHASQSVLGGIVPALHPVGTMAFTTPEFIDAAIEYASDPESERAIATFYKVLAELFLVYGFLADEERVRNDSKRYMVDADQGPDIFDELSDRRARPPSVTCRDKDLAARALRSLGEEDRRLITMRHVYGEPVQDIAKEFGRTSSWVTKRCDKLLQDMRWRLKEEL